MLAEVRVGVPSIQLSGAGPIKGHAARRSTQDSKKNHQRGTSNTILERPSILGRTALR